MDDFLGCCMLSYQRSSFLNFLIDLRAALPPSHYTCIRVCYHLLALRLIVQVPGGDVPVLGGPSYIFVSMDGKSQKRRRGKNR